MRVWVLIANKKIVVHCIHIYLNHFHILHESPKKEVFIRLQYNNNNSNIHITTNFGNIYSFSIIKKLFVSSSYPL